MRKSKHTIAQLLAEYKKVLARKRLNIALEVQSDIIEAIIQAGISIEPVTSNIPMSDESDRIFYDTALESGAILIKWLYSSLCFPTQLPGRNPVHPQPSE